MPWLIRLAQAPGPSPKFWKGERRGRVEYPPLSFIGGQVSEKGYYFVGFFVSMFIYMAIAAISKHAGIPGVETLAQLLITLALVRIFPESDPGLGWGHRALRVLSLTSLGLCAVWTFGFWIWTTHSSSFDWQWMVILPVLGILVVTPWFEEKLVRHLLLHSIDGLLGRLVSTLVVSVLFAYAHKGVMIWAFIVSITLCWLRYTFKAKTAHCVIVHGTINAYVMLLYMIW
ncbi:CPBP family intramembrane glutamic endopeptidase [Pseudoxanthomonas daejeonensis]|nr:CPBP family intramembrane glutamic endopeptidase [Pseudoxanthomonas daejeonensis]